MKYLLPGVLLIILLSAYLMFAYHHIYTNHFASESPFQQTTYYINQSVEGKTIKYVALGDSLTAGVGSNDYKQTYPYLLAKHLAGNNPLALSNLAIPGAETLDVLEKEVPEAIQEKPDYISLMVGANDIHNLRTNKDFSINYNAIITALKKETNAKIILINIPYLGSDMLIWPPYNFLFDLRTRQFNGIIKSIAEKNGLRYVDIYNLVPVKQNLYSFDGFHPSGQGYLLMGEAINADIRP